MDNKKEFIGREKEKKLLHSAISNKAGGIMVYGPRRVGKSALISNVLNEIENISFVNFECVQDTLSYNMELFTRSASESLGIPYLRGLRDFFDIFDAITREALSRRIVVVLDEYPYLRQSMERNTLDTYIQRVIDNANENLSIILCGSYVTVMKELIEYGSPLFGRMDRVISLTPFNYLEAARFYPERSVMEKIAFYSVFGGYPFVLREIDDQSLESNICRLLLDEGTSVRVIIENILSGEASRTGIPRRILARLRNSRLRYSEIETLLDNDVRGTLDKNLKRLIGMEIISKSVPINRKDDKKKTFYEISDNLLRFYYTYIDSNQASISRLGPESYLDSRICASLSTFISRRFEDVVRDYLSLTQGAEVIDIGTYWYDDRKTHTNGEFDVAMKYEDGSYGIIEVKYLTKPMSEAAVNEELKQIENIQELKISGIGFASASGFDFDFSNKEGIFITGDMLYR